MKLEEMLSSEEYQTGSWRQGKRPKLDLKKCSHCLICVNFCPEDAIKVKDGKVFYIDYKYCKGCGICAKECPQKAIDMVSE